MSSSSLGFEQFSLPEMVNLELSSTPDIVGNGRGVLPEVFIYTELSLYQLFMLTPSIAVTAGIRYLVLSIFLCFI